LLSLPTTLSLADYLPCCPLILYAWQGFICRGKDWSALAVLPFSWYLPSRNIYRETGGSRKWWHTDTRSCKFSKLFYWLKEIWFGWCEKMPVLHLLYYHWTVNLRNHNLIQFITAVVLIFHIRIMYVCLIPQPNWVSALLSFPTG